MDHIIVDHVGACVASISEEDEIEYVRQRYICRVFHFTGHRCIEKFTTGFMLDGRTLKRGKLVCISVI